MRKFAEMLKSRSIGLVLPKAHDNEINQLVGMHSKNREDFENRPFDRQVDFWLFCLATALVRNLEPRVGAVGNWGKKFVDSDGINLDDELASLLAVIAVAKLGHEDSEIDAPGRIIGLANRLAAAGCPVVLKELLKTDLRTTPLDRTLEFAAKLRDQAQASKST